MGDGYGLFPAQLDCSMLRIQNVEFCGWELITLTAIFSVISYSLSVIVYAGVTRDQRNVLIENRIRLPAASPTPESKDLFAGGNDSLVARTVGHAEGTRTATGAKTKAYWGHTDPGNGVWNLGTFSYQHQAKDQADADNKQLARLQKQFAIIQQQAKAKGIVLDQTEKLNAIDLANQAPLAALDIGGFVDRLVECKRNLHCARSRAFINPRTNRLEAPGLGNTMPGVERDQQRRMDAIAAAMKHFPGT